VSSAGAASGERGKRPFMVLRNNRRYTTRTPVLGWLYLVFALIGLAATMYYNVLAFKAFGSGYTPLAFIRAGFEGNAILGSLASDFWVGALASTLWMIAEGKQLRMRNVWGYVFLALITAWAFALPLFLFMRERHLTRGGSTARIAAARLTGRSHA
jgi:hypothetical protein